jgi:hypothetical protein
MASMLPTLPSVIGGKKKLKPPASPLIQTAKSGAPSPFAVKKAANPLNAGANLIGWANPAINASLPRVPGASGGTDATGAIATAIKNLTGGGGGLPGAAGAGGGAGGAGGAGGGVPGGGGAGSQVQLSPAMQAFQRQQQEQIDRLKAAGPDPNLQTQVNRLGERLSTDTTGRAIDRATSSIADAAAAQKAGAKTEAARRGTLGTGLGDQATGGIDEAAKRLKAGAAADISLGREKDLDALVLGGQGIMSAPGQYGMQQQNQLFNAIGQGGNMAGDIERTGQGWANVGNEQRRTDIAARDQASGQYLALLRMLLGASGGGAYA